METDQVVAAINDLADSIRELGFIYLVCNARDGMRFLDKHNTFAITATGASFQTTVLTAKEGA
jgi:hypothetical protein